MKFMSMAAGAAAVVCFLAGSAWAEAGTGCFVSPARLSDAEIASFVGQPGDMLKQFPGGGLPMVARVRALAGSDYSTVDLMMALASKASPAQASAIGSGLARVARACAKIDPAFAQALQEKVALSQVAALLSGYQNAGSDLLTASLGGGGQGGGGTASGITGGGQAGPSGPGSDNGIPTVSGEFSVGSSSRVNRSALVNQSAGTSPFTP